MTILLVGFLLVLYGILARRKYSVWVGMFFVLLIMGFQEGIPGDYEGYKINFESGGEVGGIRGSSIKETEFSIIWLTQKMSSLMNFHWYVLLTSIVQCVIIGLMIKNHVERKYHYFGVLLVFFTFNIMMVQMKAMRQGYAIEMFFLAYYLIGNCKYLLSLIPVFIGFGFHNSSMVIIPFYLVLVILMLKRSNKKQSVINDIVEHYHSVKISLIVSVVFFIFYFLSFKLIDVYVGPYLLSLEFFEYGGFLEDFTKQSTVSFFILVYYLISIFVVTLYYLKEKTLYYKYLAILVIISYCLSITFASYGNLQRIVMYFQIFSIIVYPRCASMLQSNYGRHLATGYIVFNMFFLMRTSVACMLSNDYINGNGFASFTFSFFNW